MNDTTDIPVNPRRGTLAAWAHLLRVPNLLTVPGDPIVGLLIAARVLGRVVDPLGVLAAGAASLVLYAAGLIQNDLADAREDAADRPDRPIPAGEVGKAAAIVGMLVLLAGGLGAVAAVAGVTAPPLWLAVGLAAAITLYNLLAKRIAVLGPLVMGTCRALSLLLGASLAGWAGQVRPAILLPAVALMGYIAAVSVIAAGETQRRRLGLFAWGPMFVLTIAMIALTVVTVRRYGAASLPPWLGAYLMAWTLARTAYFGAVIRGRADPPLVQAAVGQMIRGLLLLQAAFAVALAPLGAALGVFAATFIALPIAGMLGRRFRGS
ncbi:MAG: prenyltransferase [Planctomycetes bacterium]|nr:prenyltransferase [Planctomycetota bacterium]